MACASTSCAPEVLVFGSLELKATYEPVMAISSNLRARPDDVTFDALGGIYVWLAGNRAPNVLAALGAVSIGVLGAHQTVLPDFSGRYYQSALDARETIAQGLAQRPYVALPYRYYLFTHAGRVLPTADVVK